MRNNLVLLSAVLLFGAAGACSRALVWQPYADMSGDFSSEIPASWTSIDDPDLKRRPVGVVAFLGEMKAQDEGNPLGALIQVSRVTRGPSEMPAGEKARQAYAKAWLASPDRLFKGRVESLPVDAQKGLPKVSEVLLGAKTARTYEREYEHFNAAHMPRPVPMKLVDVVVRTDKAYYVIEYRATRDLFEKHRPVFERFLKSFAFGPSA